MCSLEWLRSRSNQHAGPSWLSRALPFLSGGLCVGVFAVVTCPAPSRPQTPPGLLVGLYSGDQLVAAHSLPDGRDAYCRRLNEYLASLGQPLEAKPVAKAEGVEVLPAVSSLLGGR